MIISVRLTSYTPIHPGKERGQKGKLNKRIFSYIPGTTVYGSLIRTFLDFFCPHPKGDVYKCISFIENNKDSECNEGCFYAKLLIAIKNRTFRISPFIPDMDRHTFAQNEQYNALFYNKLANTAQQELITTITRTSINTRGSVEEGHLYSLQMHNPFINYYGFIRLPEELKDTIAKLLKLLPMSPFGGKGTDALVDGEIMCEYPVEGDFLSSLPTGKIIKTITPIPFSSNHVTLPGMDAKYLISICEKTQLYGKTYMEMKRKGLYLDLDGNFHNYEKDTFISTPVIEGTFYLKEENPIDKQIFIYGIGNPDLTYLSFGQVFFDE